MDDYLDQFTEDHINGGYGDILDMLNAESEGTDDYPDFDEPGDEILAQQELEEFEAADEYFGFFGGNDEW